MLEPTWKRHPHPKTKKKLREMVGGGIIMIKSDPITTRWVTHRLGNNNTKEVLTLLWRFWSPHQTSQPGDLSKGLRRNPQESGLKGRQILIIGLREDWRNETAVLEGINKILHTPRPRGERCCPRTMLNLNYLLVLEKLLWMSMDRARHTGTGSLEGPHWHSPPGWVASGQITTGERGGSATPSISR